MIALIVCIVGLILYLPMNPKVNRLGEIMFAVGLAFTLYFFGGKPF